MTVRLTSCGKFQGGNDHGNGTGRASVTVCSSRSSVERARGQLLVVPCFPRLFFFSFFWFFFRFFLCSSSATLSALRFFPAWGGVLRSSHGASLRRCLASLRVLMCRTLGSDFFRTCLLRSGASYDTPGFRFCRGLFRSGDTFRCAPAGLIAGIVLQGIEVESKFQIVIC